MSIQKSPESFPVAPNLRDYEKTRAEFSLEAIRRELAGLPGGGLNIAHEAVEWHGAREAVAIRWLGKDGTVRDITYRELSVQTNRFANVLRGLGSGRGIACLRGRGGFRSFISRRSGR